MIGGSEGFGWPEYRNATFFQAIESLRTGNLVYVMTVDIKHIGSIFNGSHYMAIPDFVEKCF
jgi:hypothetical protein